MKAFSPPAEGSVLVCEATRLDLALDRIARDNGLTPQLLGVTIRPLIAHPCRSGRSCAFALRAARGTSVRWRATSRVARYRRVSPYSLWEPRPGPLHRSPTCRRLSPRCAIFEGG